MTNLIDPSVGTSLKDQFSWSRAKKAYSAGITGAVGAVATISLPDILADGKIDGPEVLAAFGVTAAGFVAGFFAAWLPAQRPSVRKPGKKDGIVRNDGLGAELTSRHEAP
jgi:NhaP-type Na+/H+ or K+/H+ antiporter